MIDNKFLESLPKSIKITKNASMSNYNSFKVGGNCPLLIECYDQIDLLFVLKLFVKNKIKNIVIGEGTNLLVSDNGIECVVVKFCFPIKDRIKIVENCITVPAQLLLDDFVIQVIEKNLGDITFLSGIPGTVGGAIAGNAGAFGQQIGDMLIDTEVIDRNGNIQKIIQKNLNFTYRSSYFKNNSDIILNASFKLNNFDKNKMIKKRDEILNLRFNKHPNWKKEPCAGSIFRNIEPSSAAEKRQAAGWFLEQAGVKDFKEGKAFVYNKHANIIIANSGSTASDVYKLSERMKKAVLKKFNIELIREIQLLGSF
tara:strand:- start:271 stop:1206 length:936 start_codon:yes stop_codon:yes gene_type:complete